MIVGWSGALTQLSSRGMPPRKWTTRSGIPLDQLDLTKIDPAYTGDAAQVFSLHRALAARTNPGAPSIDNVRQEIARWEKALANS